jgi:hypothetical protein
MRFTWAAISLLCSIGAVAAQQVVPVSDIDLPYSYCGTVTALRANLTGTRTPRPKATPSFGDWAFVASALRPHRGFANAIERSVRTVVPTFAGKRGRRRRPRS